MLVFLVKVIYKLSFEVVLLIKNADLEIGFEVLLQNKF
jgi:hypothetical protein